MAYTSIWTHIWDLVEEGIDPVLGRMKDDLGLDALSVSVVYHMCWGLSLRNPRRRFFAAPLSAIYFQPEVSRYRQSGIEPYVSPWLGTTNPLEQIATSSQRHGLDLGAWLCFSLNSAVAERYPECAALSAFGDRSVASLCVSNPRVRTYARELVGDLADNYGFAWLELEQFNFRSFEPPGTHGKVGIAIDPIVDWLLAVCFCEHCAARAATRGLDVEPVRRTVQAELTRAFGGEDVGRGRSLDDYVAETPGFADLAAMRTDSTVSLAREVRQATRKPLMFLYMQDQILTGADPRQIAPLMELNDVTTWTVPPDEYRAKVRALQDRGLPDLAKLLTTLSTAPVPSGREKLLAAVEAGMGLGVGGFNFYGYTTTPESMMPAVREACALAHRRRA